MSMFPSRCSGRWRSRPRAGTTPGFRKRLGDFSLFLFPDIEFERCLDVVLVGLVEPGDSDPSACLSHGLTERLKGRRYILRRKLDARRPAGWDAGDLDDGEVEPGPWAQEPAWRLTAKPFLIWTQGPESLGRMISLESVTWSRAMASALSGTFGSFQDSTTRTVPILFTSSAISAPAARGTSTRTCATSRPL